jgi:2,3-dihydroxyphenylpropionate 1,2-dioxygenase
VLVIGSGGISRAPPSLIPGARDLAEEWRLRLITDNIARAAEAINPTWDQQFLATLASAEWTRLADLTAEDLAPAGSGGAEVRTWIAARLHRRDIAVRGRLRTRHRVDHRKGDRR